MDASNNCNSLGAHNGEQNQGHLDHYLNSLTTFQSHSRADYQVGIWHAKDFELLVVFQVPYRISCVHVYKSCLLAVGHNNGCLTTWSLSLTDGCTGLFRHEYRSHTGVVMSVNVNCDIDLMISGATDFTAKLWSISSGSLLKTLVPHSHWVVQVTLLPTLENDNSKTQFSGVHSLLTMTRDHVRIYSWNVHSEGKEKYGDVSTIDKSVIELPLNSVHKFFTPGCHVVDGNAVYVKQTLIKDEHGDAEIVFQNLVTQKVSRRVQLKQKVRKLLAVGEKFALLLLPHSHYSKLNLLIIELSTGNVIGGCHLPHSSSSTPDLSQVTLGEVDWLKDLSMHKPDDIVIALGLPRGQVRAVTWRSLKEGTTGAIK
ncbi:F-box/WD repeat-containing protein 2, partial [Gryllus bimaculatus]